MSIDAKDIAWIAADWGTSNLRVWAIGNDGRPVAQASNDQGMGKLKPDEFEAALLDLIAPWMNGPTTVIACGMVGARQGWQEARYQVVPCAPMSGQLTRVQTSTENLSVHVISGLKQTKPADVMRGEETQIAGFLRLNPKWDGIICLPGTHTKWAHVSAGEVVSFQTFMTGELFGFLCDKSVLSHSVQSDGWDDGAFSEALGAPIGLVNKWP